MKIRADIEMEAMLEADLAATYGDDLMFGDDMMDITNEDVELAAEANEMSLMDTADVEARAGAYSQDDTASEASQEYGDENAVPIDPALMSAGSQKPAPLTPARPVMRTFHTTSKVPLKPADDTPPARHQARSFSAAKPSSKRPNMPARNATVISYSPTKGQSSDLDDVQPTTPGKSEIWSTMGTPARTPRRDLNTDLLRGAVVFVDVHTSEGADASAVFVELLTQMGARCVKTWTWNPSNDGMGESKIGITHVVYKDGGKRTMEKVRESNGVVQCVGVGWVLDCERENRWVEESTHYIDTALIPRGGRNRRKSMEPKAIANVNGSLVTPVKSNAAAPRECMTTPGDKMNRRDSSLWMRTPSDVDEDEDAPGEADDWRPDVSSMLTPVPKTPAPEAIARYAMDITPGSSSVEDDSTLGQREHIQMQTCPPKQSTMYSMGEEILNRPKDQTVMMRLMAARRKSLQFAPKVASPLSKSWYQG
ncbi:hypothetical protein Micbo1qcDRAFT_162837 [Microdochium bolleyi]|uniref:BRCT domain-containing protein n=1 Tax=Microdochium bolleyi TaxID=196109 RepID=A0A136J2A0_9PEZI|nr:hypothetical protein Micbo1qcDRAFT_162837 [Microdochium bolleyi]